jgi:hypothetical protein
MVALYGDTDFGRRPPTVQHEQEREDMTDDRYGGWHALLVDIADSKTLRGQQDVP